VATFSRTRNGADCTAQFSHPTANVYLKKSTPRFSRKINNRSTRLVHLYTSAVTIFFHAIHHLTSLMHAGAVDSKALLVHSAYKYWCNEPQIDHQEI
jgi:hypothetical protein